MRLKRVTRHKGTDRRGDENKGKGSRSPETKWEIAL